MLMDESTDKMCNKPVLHRLTRYMSARTEREVFLSLLLKCACVSHFFTRLNLVALYLRSSLLI